MHTSHPMQLASYPPWSASRGSPYLALFGLIWRSSASIGLESQAETNISDLWWSSPPKLPFNILRLKKKDTQGDRGSCTVTALALPCLPSLLSHVICSKLAPNIIFLLPSHIIINYHHDLPLHPVTYKVRANHWKQISTNPTARIWKAESKRPEISR